MLSLSAGVACDVYVGLGVEATIEVDVGAPYSLALSLATDRWYSTYPS